MALFKTTWQHIRRSPYQALAAVMIMGLTIFAATLFIISAFVSAEVINHFESLPQITAFFKRSATQDDAKALEQKLQDTGRIAKVRYVSQEEALQIYKEQNKDDALLLELVTADILPASLEVSATDVRFLNELSEMIKQEPMVEYVGFQKNVVDKLVVITSFIRRAGIGLISFLTLESILVIIMVIAMKIAIKREEIEIMRLLGATSWFIRTPYVYEGIFYGILGAVFAVIVSYAIVFAVKAPVTSFFSGVTITVFEPSKIALVSAGALLGGATVGVIGSLLAVWRYLKS